MKVLGNNLLIDLVLVFVVAMAVSLFGEWLSNKLKLVAFIFYPTRFLPTGMGLNMLAMIKRRFSAE